MRRRDLERLLLLVDDLRRVTAGAAFAGFPDSDVPGWCELAIDAACAAIAAEHEHLFNADAGPEVRR